MKIFRYVLIIALFYFVGYSFSPSDNANNCHAEEQFHKKAFDGVVVDKFLDKTQHSVPVILVKNFGDNDPVKINLFLEASGLFEKFNKNDTVRKVSGSQEISIKQNGLYVRFGVAEFDCDREKLKDEPIILNIYKLFE